MCTLASSFLATYSAAKVAVQSSDGVEFEGANGEQHRQLELVFGPGLGDVKTRWKERLVHVEEPKNQLLLVHCGIDLSERLEPVRVHFFFCPHYSLQASNKAEVTVEKHKDWSSPVDLQNRNDLHWDAKSKHGKRNRRRPVTYADVDGMLIFLVLHDHALESLIEMVPQRHHGLAKIHERVHI